MSKASFLEILRQAYDLNECPGQVKERKATVLEILDKCGISHLSEGSSPEEIGHAVRRMEEYSPQDRIQRNLLKEAAVPHLKKAGIKAPARLLDSACPAKRMGSAGNLSGHEIFFGEIDPWPEPVEGWKILDEVRSVLERFVVLPKGALETLSLWILLSYAFEGFSVVPYLNIWSPEMRCGKTRVLDLLELLCFRSVLAASVTVATLFRLVDKFSPTLLLDEADNLLGKNEELLGLLNSGYKAGGGACRSVGEDNEVRFFRTFGLKAFAHKGRPSKKIAALVDRSITIPMQRRSSEEKVERLLSHRLKSELEPLKRKMVRWGDDHREALGEVEERFDRIPGELNDRQAECWLPLFAIAELAGGDWPRKAREASLCQSGSAESEDSNAVELLGDVRKIFAEQGADTMSTQVILESLHQMEHRPWSEWRNGREMTPVQLSNLLKPFGIAPRQLWVGGTNKQGYEVACFKNAFERYLPERLPEIETLDSLERSTDGHFRANCQVLERDNSRVSEKAGKPIRTGILGDLGDKEGDLGQDRRLPREII